MTEDTSRFADAARRAGRDASAWTVADLQSDPRWVIALDDDDRADLLGTLRRGLRPGAPLLDYRRADFPFGQRVLGRLRAAVDRDFPKPLIHTVRGAGYVLRDES